MTTKQVQPHEVWEALLKEPSISGQPKKVQEVMRPFAEAAPTILAALLDCPVTVESVTMARAAFFRYCRENGMVEKTAAVTPKQTRTLFGNTETLMRAALNQAIRFAEAISDDVEGILHELRLTQHGITERNILISSYDQSPSADLLVPMRDRLIRIQMRVCFGGLSGETLSLYDKGELTICDLLRLQPACLLHI